MKTRADGPRHRVELGRHIVADPQICGGQPTFKGTRIMVWVILEQSEAGMTRDEIVAEWPGKVSKPAIAEAIAISDLVVKHDPFRGFDPGMQPEPLLPAEEQAAVWRKAFGAY
jgi:uncharacterized protein (DUF433 family)